MYEKLRGVEIDKRYNWENITINGEGWEGKNNECVEKSKYNDSIKTSCAFCFAEGDECEDPEEPVEVKDK